MRPFLCAGGKQADSRVRWTVRKHPWWCSKTRLARYLARVCFLSCGCQAEGHIFYRHNVSVAHPPPPLFLTCAVFVVFVAACLLACLPAHAPPRRDSGTSGCPLCYMSSKCSVQRRWRPRARASWPACAVPVLTSTLPKQWSWSKRLGATPCCRWVQARLFVRNGDHAQGSVPCGVSV